MGRIVRSLTHRSPVRRALVATAIALGLWLGSWTFSYLLIGEGVLREIMASRVPAGLLTAGPSLGLTIFSWNLLFGVGAILIGSLVGVGRVSLGYFAPWWWAVGYGVALGTNSFVLTVPGVKYAPQLDILWSHVGGREILAYLLVAAALANVHVWRPRRWHDLSLLRVRAFRDVRLNAAELSCIAGALTLLAWTGRVEAAGVAAFLK
ncbi:MAG: hypothetical protein ACRDGT_11510 [Candidatus Limnocylindria bacterium]